eukprot:SAG11_NODE_4901_length_1729_cov_2.046012_1_plen_393_part_00
MLSNPINTQPLGAPIHSTNHVHRTEALVHYDTRILRSQFEPSNTQPELHTISTHTQLTVLIGQAVPLAFVWTIGSDGMFGVLVAFTLLTLFAYLLYLDQVEHGRIYRSIESALPCLKGLRTDRTALVAAMDDATPTGGQDKLNALSTGSPNGSDHATSPGSARSGGSANGSTPLSLSPATTQTNDATTSAFGVLSLKSVDDTDDEFSRDSEIEHDAAMPNADGGGGAEDVASLKPRALSLKRIAGAIGGGAVMRRAKASELDAQSRAVQFDAEQAARGDPAVNDGTFAHPLAHLLEDSRSDGSPKAGSLEADTTDSTYTARLAAMRSVYSGGGGRAGSPTLEKTRPLEGVTIDSPGTVGTAGSRSLGGRTRSSVNAMADEDDFDDFDEEDET